MLFLSSNGEISSEDFLNPDKKFPACSNAFLKVLSIEEIEFFQNSITKLNSFPAFQNSEGEIVSLYSNWNIEINFLSYAAYRKFFGKCWLLCVPEQFYDLIKVSPNQVNFTKNLENRGTDSFFQSLEEFENRGTESFNQSILKKCPNCIWEEYCKFIRTKLQYDYRNCCRMMMDFVYILSFGNKKQLKKICSLLETISLRN